MVCAAGLATVWILFLCGAEHTLTENTATVQALICTLVFCGGKKKPELRYPLWGVDPSCEIMWEILLSRQRVQLNQVEHVKRVLVTKA